jgi:alpha-amylase
LSDDIAFRFAEKSWSEWPLTTDKFVKWLNAIDKKEEVVTIFLDYETIGERQWKETGIFDFFWSLPKAVLAGSDFSFNTPKEIADQLQPVAAIHVAHPISWADEERDLTSWLGNELQDEAFSKLYSVYDKVNKSKDEELLKDWGALQTCDHFYYMCTKWFSDGTIHKYFNPYNSPYEAFINYMNVLSDFIIRLENPPVDIPEEQKEKTPGKQETQKELKQIKNNKTATTRTGKLNFEDIINLSDSKVKAVIKNLDIETVSFAMKGAGKEVRNKVEKNLGKRALKQYQELVKQIKNLTDSEINKHRKKIINEIKSLSK